MNDHVSVMILPVGPVSVATRVWRYRGQFHVTAVAKATFSLKNGEPMATAAPLGLNAEEVPSKGASGLVRAPYDLVPLLPRADVTFVGHAYAPGNGARTERVRLAISRPRDAASSDSDKSTDGPLLLDKSLDIIGNRTATAGWGNPQPALFTKLPITYDRALGGPGHPLNPEGIGVVADGRGRTQLPNVANPPHTPMAVEPAGFGPVPMRWPSRARLFPNLARTLGDPIVELPDEVDLGHFHAAPFDQRIEFLRGDEWIILERLHPKHERLATRLPFLTGVARVHTRSGEVHALQTRADALHIDGDEETATLVFRGSFPVPSFEALRMIAITAGVELRDVPTAWPTVDWPTTLVVETGAASPLRDVAIPSTEPHPAQKRGGTMIMEDPSAGVEPPPPATQLLSSTQLRAGTLVLEPAASLSGGPVALPEAFALEQTVADHNRPISGVVPLSAWQDADEDPDDDGATHLMDRTGGELPPATRSRRDGSKK